MEGVGQNRQKMTAMPVISILTPVYNRAELIGETANSIFNQTYQNWEWVIVDDGSTDGSWDVLRKIADRDRRVKVFQRHREPKGACTCRNIAAENSSGEYLLFLDSDDLLAPFCLQQRVEAAYKAPNHDIVIFPTLLFKKQPDDIRLLWNVNKDADDLLRMLTGDAICQTSGPLWRRNIFLEIGMWNEELMMWQDVELHIRSFMHPVSYKKRFDLKPDVYLRISDDSLSRSGYHAIAKLRSRIKVFVDSTQAIISIGQLSQYIDGLKIMGINLLLSAIKNRHYDDAERLMAFTHQYAIFREDELKKIKFYMQAYRLKLYKIPVFFQVIEKKMLGVVSVPDITLGKTKWTPQ